MVPRFVAFLCLFLASAASADTQWRAVDVSGRPGVTQRFLYASPEQPVAAVILFSGGQGNLRLTEDGVMRGLDGNMLVRSRQLFIDQQLAVAVVDAPSDRQGAPYLAGFRQKPEHVADIKAVIAWLKQQNAKPVWLVGTSRGTQSAAFIATQLSPADGGPDGVVLTSTIVSDTGGRPVPDMPLQDVKVPVLIVHHEKDGCVYCSYSEIPQMAEKFRNSPRKEVIAVTGGENVGNPCDAWAYHGFNGIERDVVERIGAWIRRTAV